MKKGVGFRLIYRKLPAASCSMESPVNSMVLEIRLIFLSSYFLRTAKSLEFSGAREVVKTKVANLATVSEISLNLYDV